MAKSARPEKGSAARRSPGRPRSGVTPRRPWAVSLGMAALFVGLGVALSAAINPLFGRYVHWDWMAGLAPTLFATFALALRRRWV